VSQNPVVVIPGITASQLADRYTVAPDTVWSLVQRDFARVALHPDDRRYERGEPARVTPDRVFAIPYEEFIEDLRHDLSAPGHPTPVFPFSYDWRQPLAATETCLAEFIEEVIDRTRLLRHYGDAWRANPKVDLVGHSMGGLVIAGYLESRGALAGVGKVITLGAPFRGSFEAVLKITTGLAQLGMERQSSSEREAARMTPALYHLLPDYEDALAVESGLPLTLFDPSLWQPSVVQTITQCVEHFGLPCDDPRARAEDIFRDLLTEAHAHRTRVLGLSLENAGLTSRDWLCIAGVDQTTRHQLRIERENGTPDFALDSSRRENRFRDPGPAERHKTGDGTVPLRGALPPFIPLNEILSVTPDDFGYWELGDQILKGPVGLHGLLPKMNLINRLAAAFLTGKKRRGTWGRAVPSVQSEDWQPPVPGIEVKD